VRRLDLPVLAGGDGAGLDLDPEPAARPRVQLRAGAHPGHELGGIGQVREDGLGRSRDLPLDLHPRLGVDQLVDLPSSSASASSASRPMSRVHIRRR